MKAVIVAAGESKRMKHLADNLPKCLLPAGDKTLLTRSVDTLIALDIKDIYVVVGFLKEKIMEEFLL